MPPSDAGQRLAASQAQEDLRVLRSVLEESHPSLYRYTPKPQLDSAFESVRRGIMHELDLREFYALVSKLLAQIKDGHTSAYLPGNYRKYVNSAAPVLPVRIRWENHRAIVSGSFHNQIPTRAQILAVDGANVKHIMEQISAHLSGDADIETGKAEAISDNFAIYYYLFLRQNTSFLVTYQTSEGARRSIRIKAVPSGELTALGPPATNSDAAPHYERLAVSHAARLTVPTFALPAAKEGGTDFSASLAEAFRQVAADGIEDLVIDMRGNDGGDTLGPLMFSYLTNRPFRAHDSVEAVSRTFPLLHEYSQLGATFSAFQDQLASLSDGHFSPKAEVEHPLTQPQAHPYLGRVWVLIDGNVFSAATEFCSLVRSQQRGKFLGEETGGAYHGYTGGEFGVITLPHSKLRVAIPLLRIEMARSDPTSERRGVIPEYPFHPNVAQWRGNDAELDLVQQLMVSERRRNSKQSCHLGVSC